MKRCKLFAWNDCKLRYIYYFQFLDHRVYAAEAILEVVVAVAVAAEVIREAAAVAAAVVVVEAEVLVEVLPDRLEVQRTRVLNPTQAPTEPPNKQCINTFESHQYWHNIYSQFIYKYI